MNPSTIVVGSRVAQANPAGIDMVNGTETAAVVLAVLPLLIQALSAYNSGLEKTGLILGLTKNKQKKYKVKVERISIQLEWGRANLHLDLLKLIGRAAPAEDITCLPEQYDDLLWTGETAEKIKAYLQCGGTFDTFKNTLSIYTMAYHCKTTLRQLFLAPLYKCYPKGRSLYYSHIPNVLSLLLSLQRHPQTSN